MRDGRRFGPEPRRPAAALALGATPAAAALVTAASPARAQERLDRGLAIAPDAYVRVMAMAGDVRIVGWEEDSLSVRGTVDAGGEFYMGGAGRSAKLGVSPARTASASPPRSTLRVRVPRGATVWVKTESADVTVEGLSGGLDALSVTGRIEVRGELRQVYAESMGGDVVIEASAPTVRAKTAGGSVRFRGEAEDITATTVAGDVTVEAPPVERGRFESVTGDVRFRGSVRRGGSLSFHTHSGRVELAVPAGLDADFSVTTIEGEVLNDLGGADAGESTPGAPREVSFLRGGGGASVTVQTYSGAVVLRTP